MRRQRRTMLIITAWLFATWAAPAQLAGADTLSLAQAVERAVKNHPLVRAAEGELRTLHGAFWEVVSPPAPVFRIENEEVPQGGELSRYGLQTVGISQSLDFPLVTYHRARASRESARAAKAAYELALAEAKGEITMAYVGAWTARLRLAIFDSLAHAASALAEAAGKRYAAGDATPVERDRLRALAEQSARQRESARLTLDLAWANLRQAVGSVNGVPFDIADPGLPDPILLDSAAASIGARVQQARWTLKAAQARHTASRLSFLPQLEVELFRQRDREQQYWGGAIGLSVPVWHLLGGRGEAMQTSGEVRRAAAELEQTRRRWSLDWIEATRAYEITQNRLRSLEQIGLPASRSAYNASMQAYRVGELGVTDLLATFLETRTAELEYLDAREEVWRWRSRLDVLAAPGTPK